MKKILECRRSSLALIGMLLLTILGYTKGADVAVAIATISIGVSGANAFEKKGGSNQTPIE